MKTKICIKCGLTKSVSEFLFRKDNNKYRNECKKCKSLQDKIYRKKHPYKTILGQIKTRCENKHYPEFYLYGGRGIKCLITIDEIRQLMKRDGYWGMKRPSIDRKDNNDNYTFENCQFIELSENCSKDKEKHILQYDLDGNFIREWISIKKTENILQIHNISACCRGLRRKAGGFVWRYKQ